MDITTTTHIADTVDIPNLGLGVFRSPDGKPTADAVRWAIEAGYRHIDTARIYGNEKSVGQGVRDSGVPREQLFITTKLWNDDMRAGRQLQAIDASLKDLGMDYVDLYLIHWPVENYVESWTAMEKILASGKARSIGVSNFKEHHLDTLLEEAGVVPAINQVELHPFLTQEPLRRYCRAKGIAVEAWSPLGGQGGNVLQDKTIAELGKKYGKSPAQVVIRWHLQHGIVTIPKSVHEARIKENCDVFDFEISAEDMKRIDALNTDTRVGSDPDNFDF
ncbi:MAG: aldo/keto reductase [Planctomycetaceae bacterium]|nr:aldo/keto reductase [Planctomycetaceae bacterium]